MNSSIPESIAKNNIRRFIIFKALFNARFYYPVFAVIFLDFGLTLDQFAILNVIWAATIILAEVPSGALSDLIGRKMLLMLTSTLMVMEMAVWAFAPTGNPTQLFWILAINRVLSGLGEASASGSDEALVYESLENAGMKDQWSNVLEKASRWQSVAFMIAMVSGGFIYDPTLVQKLLGWIGIEGSIDKSFTLRLPLYLTLITSVICWINCMGFIESRDDDSSNDLSIFDAFKQTYRTAIWIWQTPFAIVLILAGAFADSVIRMFVTLGSEYYRLIQYPEFALGIIGFLISLVNLAMAPVAKRLVDRHSPSFIFFVVTTMAVIGFLGISYFVPYIGLIFSAVLFAAFFIVSFSLSYYLNRISDKSTRATVISFKGMALNLGYGFIGILYAQLLRILTQAQSLDPRSDELFINGAQYFTPYFVMGSIVVVVFTRFYCPRINQLAEKTQKNAE